MTKRTFSLAAILSAAALTSGVLLASINPADASPCGFARNQDTTATTSGDSPTLSATQSDFNRSDINKIGIIGAGMAAVAGLFVIGMAYRLRRAEQEADTFIAEVSQEDAFIVPSFSIPIPPEALSTSTDEQETSDSTAQKDLTPVS